MTACVACGEPVGAETLAGAHPACFPGALAEDAVLTLTLALARVLGPMVVIWAG